MRPSSWLCTVLAALVFASSPPALGAEGAAEPSPAAVASAQRSFEAASRHFDAKRFEEAAATFRASYEVVESPNTRLMVARSLRELGNVAEAYAEYEAVIREAKEKGKRYESAAQAGTDEQAELRDKVGFVTVRFSTPQEGARVTVAGRRLDPAKLGSPFPVAAGPVVVTGALPDGTAARAEATVAAGATAEMVLDFAAAPPAPVVTAAPAPVIARPQEGPPPSLRPFVYVAGGVGVAGLAAFGVFGAMSGSKYSDLESSCPDRQCPPSSQDDIDSGKTYQAIANLGLGLGIIGLGTAATLFFLDRGSASQTGALRVDVGLSSISITGPL